MSRLVTKSTAVEGAMATPHSRSLRLADLNQLTKPRITVMVAITASIGFIMAWRSGHDAMPIAAVLSAAWPTLLAVIVGTSLSCMGSSALNQVLERDTDALMPRTMKRPLPTGVLTPTSAAVIGLSLVFVGVATLIVFTTGIAAAINAFTVASYVLVYTPMKRRSNFATIVGAVPGALPPVIGATAATGVVGVEAVLLFAILFLWQLPHFLAIAWLYRDDYALANIPVLPVIEPDGRSTFRQITIGCMALLPLGLMPTMFGVSGLTYFFGALLCGAAFMASGLLVALRPTRANARTAFFVSLIYLPTVFALMLIDQT